MVTTITIGLVGINVAIFYWSASDPPHKTFLLFVFHFKHFSPPPLITSSFRPLFPMDKGRGVLFLGFFAASRKKGRV